MFSLWSATAQISRLTCSLNFLSLYRISNIQKITYNFNLQIIKIKSWSSFISSPFDDYYYLYLFANFLKVRVTKLKSYPSHASCFLLGKINKCWSIKLGIVLRLCKRYKYSLFDKVLSALELYVLSTYFGGSVISCLTISFIALFLC